MNSRKIVTIALAILCFIAGIILGAVINTGVNNVAEENGNSNSVVIGTFLEVRVYDRDGHLINTFVKTNDLPLKNFLLFIMHSMWFYDTSIQIVNGTWTTEDGSSGMPCDGNPHGAYYTTVAGIEYISVRIELGNGTTPPTINDYKLENKLVDVPVTYYCFDANATHMWLILRGVYTATEEINITEVGLAVYSNYAIGTARKWILLFRDVVPTITLQPDQTLEIRYYIYVRYA
ncbi:MAG: hypothetical protein DRJ40_08000 [Thermoprotei archaeon]|nr:MAG: hypothetical protein DRJ40_08000 [Thermoprotei archaeon]